jgi:hypothetical protein
MGHGHTLTNLLPSIDLMLEHRVDLRSPGKKLMAALLLQEEENVLARRGPVDDDDWISLVFTYMCEECASVEDFGNNPVHFLTFNYDRFLEYRLIRGLTARYNIEARRAWRGIRNISFLHLYGSLGLLPEQGSDSTIASERVWTTPFGASDNDPNSAVAFRSTALQSAENSIQIVHDSQNETSFQSAEKILKAAEQVVFLGFAFGRENVSRLKLLQSVSPSIPLYCTTYGMTQAEVFDRVETAFHDRTRSSYTYNMKSTSMLRERVQIFR